MNDTLHLLGIAKKAGKLEIGEEPTGAAARARQAKLILVARDAADNTFRRVRHFAEAGNVIWISVPATKEELGRAVGRTSCAMLAVIDVGIAAAVARQLAARDPEKYAITAERLAEQSAKALQRQREKRQHEKNRKKGLKKVPAPLPPSPKPPAGAKKRENVKPAHPKAGVRLKAGRPLGGKLKQKAPLSPGGKRRER